MVHIEQGALRTLQQDGLTALERQIQFQPGIGDPVLEAVRLTEHLIHHLPRIQCTTVVDLHQDLVLELQRRLDLLGQDLLVEHIGDAHPDPGDLVLIARTDAAPGGAYLLIAEEAFGDLIDGHVVRHDQVRVGREQQSRSVDATLLQPGQLGQQDAGIDHDTIADDVRHARGEDAGGNQMQCELVAIGQDNRVTGVITALVPDHPLQPATEQVGCFALTLVAPLGADQDDCRHGRVSYGSTRNSHLLQLPAVSRRWPEAQSTQCPVASRPPSGSQARVRCPRATNTPRPRGR